MVRAFMCAVLLSSTVHLSEASGLVVTRTGVVYLETFDGFGGTHATLPPGWGVSKDGANVMASGDDDFRGIHSGGVTYGGCYAWCINTNKGDRALGYQPTSDEFTPGHFMLVISNATGANVRSVLLSYDVVWLNNADRSSTLDLEFSLDGQVFTRISQMSVCTPAGSELAAKWVSQRCSMRVNLPKAVSTNRCVWVRWRGDDAGGTGSRDEYGLNNVRVVLYPADGTIIEIR